MARAVQLDQQKRTVEVDRLELIKTLEENRVKHIQDYEEAMAGYRSRLLSKIEEGFNSAKEKLETKYEQAKCRVETLTDQDISKQKDIFPLIDSIYIEMTVPRSYREAYDAAIDMAKWDVRDTLELTHAEFTCFVRDQWDWKSNFDEISTMYKAIL